MGNINLITVVLGELQTNCYLLSNIQSNAAIIIDPAADFPIICDMIIKNNLKPAAILLTHGHFDHMGAAAELNGAYNIPIVACADELALLADPRMNGSQLMLGMDISVAADQWVRDGDVISPAGFDINVIATPGHTGGGVCYYIEDEGTLFSGDTLFRGSYGRTDLPTGDAAMLARSIKDKLFALPGGAAVYPGHGRATDIGYEKQKNMINF